MDSVTQAALGAAVAGACAGKKCSIKTLLAGALLGTLPDLDILIPQFNSVEKMINHRGFSHSVVVLVPFSAFIAYFWHRCQPKKLSFSRLWLIVAACLITHPLLDSFTTYGTHLFWPLPKIVAINSIFIIDPAYSLPLLLGLFMAFLCPSKGAKACTFGLILSSFYLLWSVYALHLIQQRVERHLMINTKQVEKVLISPTPFNTILWRVILLNHDNYQEGLVSLLDKETKIDFNVHPRGYWPFSDKPQSLIKLENFTNHFVSYKIEQKHLIVTDLRLGLGNSFPFAFVFAEQSHGPFWQLVEPYRLYPKHFPKGTLKVLWQRLLGTQSIAN